MLPKSQSFISGQSLLEVVLALAIFALMAAAFVSLALGSVSNVSYGTDFLTASTLADQGVGTTRALRDNAWNSLTDGVESATLDNRFNRAITISPVDLETKLLKTEVSWPSPVGAIQKITRQTRLTNWDSRDWIQTDWSGGQYSSVDPTLDVSVAGQISLKAKPLVWSLFVDTGTQTWNDIWMFSPSSGLVVGASGQTGRFNGTWTTVAVGTTNWNAIYCLATNDCYAPGAAGRIGRWNGSSWSVPAGWDTGNQTWNDIWMFSPSSGFVVGNGGIIWRWNGTSWSNITSSTAQNLNAIYCSSASNCFAVGGTTAGTAGTILRWNGTAWSLYSPSPTTQILNSVFLGSPNDGWAIGGSGTILRLTGGGYETSGVLTSSIFNMVDASPAQIIEWDEQIPVCVPASACNIKFQIRTGNSTMSDASWPVPPFDFNFITSAGAIINPSYNGKQYAQYQVKLTGDGASTPVLQEVRLNYK